MISYVPAFLHIHVAKVCLELGRNLITASYISKEMEQLHEQVKQKGLTFLNKLWLDPGIRSYAHYENPQRGGGAEGKSYRVLELVRRAAFSHFLR